MKLWNDDLSTHYSWSTTRLAMFWRVDRTDGETFGWVDHDRDVEVANLTYRSAFGLRPTATQTTIDMKPGTMDVTSFLDVATEEELEAGVWDEADIFVFEAPWDKPPASDDAASVNILLTGRLGQIGRKSGVFTAQLHGMLERLDNVIGEVYTPTCPWRLGDERCTVDLAPHTHEGSITDAARSRFQFNDDAHPQEPGYYNEGTLRFTSGRNQGYFGDVREYSGTTFLMHRPFPYAPEVGDTYVAVRGDDKRLETCRDVFNNYVNFRGFPDIPGQDVVLDNPLAVPLSSPDEIAAFPPIEEGGPDTGGDGGDSGGDSGDTGATGEGEGTGEAGEGGGAGTGGSDEGGVDV